jgi:hypothetical protein
MAVSKRTLTAGGRSAANSSQALQPPNGEILRSLDLAACLYYVIIDFNIAIVLSATTNATHILIPITHQALTLIAPFLLHVWRQLPSLA